MGDSRFSQDLEVTSSSKQATDRSESGGSLLVPILVANFLPAVGVLFFGWRIFDVVLIYWLENVVIGLFNLVKILSCRPDPDVLKPALAPSPHRPAHHASVPPGSRIGTAFLFMVHYGMFTFVHGAFLGILLKSPGEISSPAKMSLPDSLTPTVWLSVLAIAASHLYRLIAAFYLRGEYRRRTPRMQMGEPYGRVIVLHLAILASGFLIMRMQGQLVALLVLIAGKTCMEYRLARRARLRAA